MTDKPRIQIVGGPPKGSDEELRQWLENHIKQYPHLNTEVLARSSNISVSRTALDAYLADTYFLPKDNGGQGVDPKNSNLERKIQVYRERIEGTVRHGYANTFVESRTWLQMQAACSTAISENVIVVVYGKPGVGKSRSLREFATRKMTTSPIEILCSSNVTTRYFAQLIAREIGLDDRPSTPQLEDNIAEKLKRNPRPLFVDQANYLNEKALGTVCHVWEKARVPIVLIGTKDLHDLFMSSRLTEDVRAQLSSRVAMHYPLAELTKEECISILKRALGEDATPENIAAIINVTKGVHRHIDMIIPRINELKNRKNNKERLANGEIKMIDIIQTAGHRLMAG